MENDSVVQSILKSMEDTKDPEYGAVFEKTVKATVEDFVHFIEAVYPRVKIHPYSSDSSREASQLFYSGRTHVGTYVTKNGVGYFGGSRMGSKNPMRKPGKPQVKNPFKYSGAQGEGK